MSVKELMDLIVAAIGDLQGLLIMEKDLLGGTE